MSAPTAKFLMELLEGEQAAIEAIELQLSADDELTSLHRSTLVELQTAYEGLCDKLEAAIREHDFIEELPE